MAVNHKGGIRFGIRNLIVLEYFQVFLLLGSYKERTKRGE